MTVFHFFNCAILTFGPHAVYYSATPLSEYDTIGTSVKAALVYLGTALVKLVCLATFLKVPENDSFDPYQVELCQQSFHAHGKELHSVENFPISLLFFCCNRHQSFIPVSTNGSIISLLTGWAFADSVLHRLAPLWVGARGLEFTWEYILQGLQANANLVFTVSLAAMGSLMWLLYLRRGLGWHLPKVVGFELLASLVMAFISWQLFSACQRLSV
ncbi:hypothetical protein HHK36_003128 [Tetracentron sinense]|uniref:BOS complex subunit TMEM147 n=1 Tax=Tetracentron sinense TaxID=13715 RepID=A0A835DP18_TETSI|nr:hypothetical protein HHK36_003128 [Tetracentron sinense]